MPSSYYITVTDAFGNPLFSTSEFLEIGQQPGLNYVLNCGQVGAMTVTLPPDYDTRLVKDGRIGIWRSVSGAPAKLEGESVFLIRRWDYGQDYTTVTALHANDLIRRRAVLYDRRYSIKGIINNEPADDAMKTKWKQVAGSLIDATYYAYSTVTATNDLTQADLSAYVSVQANVSAGPSDLRFVYWRNLLDVFHEIQDTAFTKGTYVTAEMCAPTAGTLELRTYTGQRGVDRRFSTGSGLLFSAARGNFANAVLSVDATNEITFGEAIGQGMSASQRDAGTAKDATRMGESPFGRIEVVVDAADNPNDASLTNMAAGGMREARPVIVAQGDLVETDQCVRGVHFDYGDQVTVEVRGVQYDMRLNVLSVAITGGNERVTVKFAYNG